MTSAGRRGVQAPLAVFATHPIQYQAPVYQRLVEIGVPTVALFGSDFSVAEYHDREFGTSVRWDVDLLGGYRAEFLTRVARGGATTADRVVARDALRVLKAAEPAAVLLTGYNARFHRAAIWAALRARVPILLRAETTDAATPRSGVRRLVRDSALRALYSRVDRALYIGANSRTHYIRLGVGRERLVFAPYAVDTRPFRMSESARNILRAETRQRLGIAPDRIVVAYAGKLSTRKGVDLLVAALKRSSDRPRMTLLLVGDGDQRAALEAHAGESPRVEVCAVGFQGQASLSAMYHAADVFCLPSRHGETWGLVVNEALHHGLPCLVSDAVGSSCDLVVPGVTGERVAAGSVEALTAGLGRLIGWRRGDRQERARCQAQVAPYSVDAAACGIARAFRSVTSSAVIDDGASPEPHLDVSTNREGVACL